MSARRKFKAVSWPQMSASGGHRAPAWYVVEVNERDGSYYPHNGPVSRAWAAQEADRRQREWEAALAEAEARLDEA